MVIPPVPPLDPATPPLLPGSAEANPPSPVARWRWWVHLLLLAAYPLVIGILGAQVAGEQGAALSDNPRELLLVSTEAMIGFGVLFGLAWLASRATSDDLLLRWRNKFWPVPLGIGYSVALRFSVGIVAGLVVAVVLLSGTMKPADLQQYVMANRPDVETVVDLTAMRENPVYYWLTLTWVSFVVAGFREELWRAGLLAGLQALWPRAFGGRWGGLLAAVLAAVVFGIGHLPQGVLAVVMTGLLGLGLGAIMVFHRSIWPAVIAHGMFDATSLALLPWIMDKVEQLQRSSGH